MCSWTWSGVCGMERGRAVQVLVLWRRLTRRAGSFRWGESFYVGEELGPAEFPGRSDSPSRGQPAKPGPGRGVRCQQGQQVGLSSRPRPTLNPRTNPSRKLRPSQKLLFSPSYLAICIRTQPPSHPPHHSQLASRPASDTMMASRLIPRASAARSAFRTQSS